MAYINKKKFPERLQDACEHWREMTKPMRAARMRMLEHYAGGWYKGNETISQPINFIDRGVQILGPFLVANNPKVMVDSKRNLANHKPFCRTLELALEHLFKEIRLSQNTLRPAVTDALFGMGITKCGVTAEEEVEINGYWHDVTQPYCDTVDFENYVADITATKREDMEFEGDSYRIPEEFVKTSGLYKNYDNLTCENPQWGDETPESMAKGRKEHSQAFRELRKTVRLIDIYIPDEGVIVTIPHKGQGDKILRTMEWKGPEGGPYDVLGFRWFPGTTVPIPPVWMWLDINNVLNKLIKKMKDQAGRSKNVVLYNLSAQEDMETIVETPDGGTAGVRNIDEVKEVTIGGINEAIFPMIQYLEQQYSITGGNLYTLGGRETMADTLGQEQMLQANASKQLEDMVDQVHLFTKSIINKLAWFLWSDPLKKIPVIKRVAGFELEVEYSPEVKEGDFFDYGFDMEPYSMSRMSPEMRYQRLIQMISQVVLPTAQIAASQGSMLNVTELVKETARFLDVRNMDRWWVSAMPSETYMNPYQPDRGQVKQEVATPTGDTRTVSGSDKMKTAGNLNNHIQQQSRAYGQSSPGQQPGATTKGL